MGTRKESALSNSFWSLSVSANSGGIIVTFRRQMKIIYLCQMVLAGIKQKMRQACGRCIHVLHDQDQQRIFHLWPFIACSLIDIFNLSTPTIVSFLQWGQNRGKFKRTVSSKIFTRVFPPQSGQTSQWLSLAFIWLIIWYLFSYWGFSYYRLAVFRVKEWLGSCYKAW